MIVKVVVWKVGIVDYVVEVMLEDKVNKVFEF